MEERARAQPKWHIQDAIEMEEEGKRERAHEGGAGVADLDRRRPTITDFAGDGFESERRKRMQLAL